MKTVVIGVGNEYRRDDAVGIVLARRLRARGLTKIEVVESSGEGAALMDAWAGADRVFIIDAVQFAGEAGSVRRIAAHEREVPSGFFNYSTHAFSVAESIELARALDQLPASLVIYGVEGRNFAMGQGFSPEVEAVIEEVETRIAAEIAGENDA